MIIITTSRNFRMHILLRLQCDVGHAVDLCRVVGVGVKSWAGLLSLEMAGGLYLEIPGNQIKMEEFKN